MNNPDKKKISPYLFLTCISNEGQQTLGRLISSPYVGVTLSITTGIKRFMKILPGVKIIDKIAVGELIRKSIKKKKL